MEADVHALLLLGIVAATFLLCFHFRDEDRSAASRVRSAFTGGGIFFLLTFVVSLGWT